MNPKFNALLTQQSSAIEDPSFLELRMRGSDWHNGRTPFYDRDRNFAGKCEHFRYHGNRVGQRQVWMTS